MSRAMASREPCGCAAWIEVLGYGMDDSAYKTAAKEVKAGRIVENVDVDEWKARGLRCPDHPKGPPWWKSNGGNGKRPAEYAPTIGMGL